MNHEEIKILISAYLDGEVTPSEKDIVEEHLRSCESCHKDFQMYRAMSSSLKKWTNESLSPDEEINVQKRFEQRRAPMFTKRRVAVFTSVLVAMIVGVMVQTLINRQSMGRLTSSASDVGDQYADGNTNEIRKSTQYEPSYMQSDYRARDGEQEAQYIDSSLGAVTHPVEFLAARPVEVNARFMGMSDAQLAAPGFNMARAYASSPINYQSKVRKTGMVGLLVEDAGKTQVELENVIAKYNGIIVDSQFNQSTEERAVPRQNNRMYTSSGTVVFTVLPENLRKVLLEIRKLGDVILENQNGEDVTQQYLESQQRLDNDQQIMDRFHKILERNIHNADGVQKIDNVQQIESEMEELQSVIQQDKLSLTQTDMATMTVSFYEKSDNPFKSMMNKWPMMFQRSYEGFVNAIGIMMVLFSSLLPFIVVVSLVLWAALYLIKKYLK